MKKQLLSCAIALTLSAPASAAVLIGNYGASTTLGQIASPATLNAVRYNPAAAYLALDAQDQETLRVGYWSQLGASAEFGAADNFQDDIDQLMDTLSQFEQDVANGVYTTEAEANIAALRIQNDFNRSLVSFGEAGRIKMAFSSAIPLLPTVFKVPSLPGVFSLEAGLSAISSVTFIDAPLTYNPTTQDLATDSLVYVKGGTLLQAGLGYSQPVATFGDTHQLKGELIIGVKANLYNASLASVEAKIDRDDDKEVSDLISDGLDDAKDSSAVGIDLGVVWVADHYQLGLTAKNLNGLEFDYNTSNNPIANDEISQGKISIDPQGTLDGAVFLKDRMLMLAASADLNAVNDLVGDQVQMAHVSAAFFPAHAMAPTIRLGYEKNLAGEKLSAINLGLGLFRGVANLDLTYGLENTEIDGNTLPRRLGLQLSFEESF